MWLDSKKDFPEDRVSYGVLKELAVTPAAALHKKRFPQPPTPAMEFGKAVDALLLQSETTAVAVHHTDKSRLTKEFKEAKADFMESHDDGVYLDKETFAKVDACVLSTVDTPLWKNHMLLREYNKAGILVEGVGDDKVLREAGEYNKAGILVEGVGDDKVQVVANIIDFYTPTAIYDLKCVNDVTEHAFRNQVDRMRWDVQAASYVRMTEAITGNRLPFYWFCVGNAEPWNVAVWKMDDDWIIYSEDQLVRWIDEWAAWKDHEIEREARCVSMDVGCLQRPPWRR
jgi:hypothetical protein